MLRFEFDSVLKRRIFISLGAMAVFLIVLEIWAVNRLSTYGEQINDLEKTRVTLQLENQDLKNQIASKISLSEVEKESANIGLSKTKTVEYITSDTSDNLASVR